MQEPWTRKQPTVRLPDLLKRRQHHKEQVQMILATPSTSRFQARGTRVFYWASLSNRTKLWRQILHGMQKTTSNSRNFRGWFIQPGSRRIPSLPFKREQSRNDRRQEEKGNCTVGHKKLDFKSITPSYFQRKSARNWKLCHNKLNANTIVSIWWLQP